MHVRASLHGWTWLLISANLVVFVLVLDAKNLVLILAVKRGVTYRAWVTEMRYLGGLLCAIQVFEMFVNCRQARFLSGSQQYIW